MLPLARNAVAPNKSDVRLLLELDTNGTAHFEMPQGQISRAVSHNTASEIWYILGEARCGARAYES
jgi:mannose-6-phosphate isomerase-like protein (cupin superfamily)